MAQTYRLVFVLGLLGLMGFEAIAQQSVVDADRFSATEAPPAQPTAMEEWWVQENATPPVPTPLLSVQASDDPGSKLGVFSGSRIQISGNLSLVGLAGTDRASLRSLLQEFCRSGNANLCQLQPTTRILPIPLRIALSLPAKRSVWSTAVNEFTHVAESQHSRLSALKAVFLAGRPYSPAWGSLTALLSGSEIRDWVGRLEFPVDVPL